MKDTNSSEHKPWASAIGKSVAVNLVMAAIALCLGIFFILFPNNNTPVGREDALSYAGTFEKYESFKNDCRIYFADGTQYSVYPHTESKEFFEAITSLSKGTKLYLLVNPNNDYVAEVKTDTEELLNFELSQEAIDQYGNKYRILGYVVSAAGVLLFLYAIFLANYKRKEKARHAERRVTAEGMGGDSPSLRHADDSVKHKVLAEASAGGYTIRYRRVKLVNELVISGEVYDEKKGIIEAEHRLFATLDGHSFEAGLDETGYSYILFDGEVIAYKKRLI